MLAQRDADYSLHVSALNTNSTFMETGPIWSLVRSMKKGGKQKAEGLKVIVIDKLPLVFLTLANKRIQPPMAWLSVAMAGASDNKLVWIHF